MQINRELFLKTVASFRVHSNNHKEGCFATGIRAIAINIFDRRGETNPIYTNRGEKPAIGQFCGKASLD